MYKIFANFENLLYSLGFLKCIVSIKCCTKIEFVNSIDYVYIDILWAFL